MNIEYSLIKRSWFYHRPLSISELKQEIVKFNQVPHVSQVSSGNSFNRLIIDKKEDFLMPSFIRRAIGYPSIQHIAQGAAEIWSPDASLHTAIDWIGCNSANLEFAARWISSFSEKQEELDILRDVRLDTFEFELFLSGWPMHVKYRPPWHWAPPNDPQKSRSRIIARPFGWRDRCESRDNPLKYDLDDPDGIGYCARSVVDEFLQLLEPCTAATSVASGGDTLVLDFNRLETANVLNHLIGISKSAGRILSGTQFQIPAHAHIADVEKFANDLLCEHHKSLVSGFDSRLSYCLMLDGKRLAGFLIDGEEFEHGDIFHEPSYEARPCAPQYLQEQKEYLLEYIDWLAGTARLKTVSGAVPAYALLYHHKDFISLVALPIGNQFVLCLVPHDLNTKIRSNSKLFSVIGSPKDWRFGEFPLEGAFTLPVLPDRHSSGLGESSMPASSPFEFQNHLSWVRKAVKEYRVEKKKSNDLLPVSLDEQLARLMDAGLELSPGINVEDFLLLRMEKEYQDNPYTYLLETLYRRNDNGVIFSPQAIHPNALFPDHPIEVTMISDFQKACSNACQIKDIKVNYRLHNQISDRRLRNIRFIANETNVLWTFGLQSEMNNFVYEPNASVDIYGNIDFLIPGEDYMLERCHHILVEYFQTFLKVYSDEFKIYKFRNPSCLQLCLSEGTAKKMAALVDLYPAPELPNSYRET